jgi:pimeloyl-ACP methyl ester carboxylesterase
MRYALRYPERVIAQVFTNSTSALAEADAYGGEGGNAEALADALLAGGREGIERLPVHPAYARRLGPGVKEALLQDCANISPLGVANAIRYTLPEVSVRGEVGNNRVPSLLVCGVREARFFPFRDFAIARMPMLECVELDAGHAVNAEAAEEFNAAVKAFIREHK